MTLREIYETYARGSAGFTKAIETHCGFNATSEEIRRIAVAAQAPHDFKRIWANDDWWRDGFAAGLDLVLGEPAAFHLREAAQRFIEARSDLELSEAARAMLRIIRRFNYDAHLKESS